MTLKNGGLLTKNRTKLIAPFVAFSASITFSSKKIHSEKYHFINFIYNF